MHEKAIQHAHSLENEVNARRSQRARYVDAIHIAHASMRIAELDDKFGEISWGLALLIAQ
jgi:hypothetical protein